jgi:predicted nucleic acid-binding protein
LDELKCVYLLSEFSEVLVPSVVWQEVRRHRPSALRTRRVVLRRVEVLAEASPELEVLREEFGLDPGEEEALRLMRQFPRAILLTDDAAAREVATHLGCQVHGTIGVLLLAWQRGRKSKRQLLNLLRTIPERSTLHISPRLLTDLIARVKEETS